MANCKQCRREIDKDDYAEGFVHFHEKSVEEGSGIGITKITEKHILLCSSCKWILYNFLETNNDTEQKTTPSATQANRSASERT